MDILILGTLKIYDTFIASYKYKHKNKRKNSPADILNVIDRLKKYKEYQIQIRSEVRKKEKKEHKKFLKKVRRESYRKAFKSKPITNPYIEVILQARRQGKHVLIDPNLEKMYNSINLYTLFEFRSLRLPRSNYEVKAGQAWGGLIKAWKGFKISHRVGDDLYTEYMLMLLRISLICLSCP